MNDRSLFFAITFFLENISPMSFSKNQTKTTGNNIIVSEASPDKKNVYVVT
jgi:hypothetical protein